MKYFISAPFGNYIKRPEKAVSVTGTWTVRSRSGLSKQILKTLRYVKTDGHWGWRNKLGLRNAGINVGLSRTDISNEVCSIAAIEKTDWVTLFDIIPPWANIEVNISCPNLHSNEDTTRFDGFERFTKIENKYCNEEYWGDKKLREWMICKIPPTASENLIDQIVHSGFDQIHASNTLPSKKGGLSGKVLIPHTLRIVKYIKTKYPHVTIIAGGGVTEPSDVDRYLNAGASHISLGSVCFRPWKLKKLLAYQK